MKLGLLDCRGGVVLVLVGRISVGGLFGYWLFVGRVGGGEEKGIYILRVY